jgi:DNA-directed RNA polymerase specialized sigma subunit
MLYVEKLPDAEVAKRLSVSLRHLTFLKKAILEVLIKASHTKDKKKSLRGRLHGYSLTKKERQIWELRAVDGLSFAEIAGRLGIPKSSAHYIFDQVQNKCLSRELLDD